MLNGQRGYSKFWTNVAVESPLGWKVDQYKTERIVCPSEEVVLEGLVRCPKLKGV